MGASEPGTLFPLSAHDPPSWCGVVPAVMAQRGPPAVDASAQAMFRAFRHFGAEKVLTPGCS